MHVLGLPPAFVLSQDQTLRLKVKILVYPPEAAKPQKVVTAVTLGILRVLNGQYIVLSAHTDSTCMVLTETQDRQRSRLCLPIRTDRKDLAAYVSLS